MKKGFGLRMDAYSTTMNMMDRGNRSPSKPASDVVPIPMTETPATHHSIAIIK